MAADVHRGRDLQLRRGLVAAVHRLDASGLNRGSTGNVSVRGSAAGEGAAIGAGAGETQGATGIWITPSGMEPENLDAGALSWIGDDGGVLGHWQPSSEWPFHRAIYQQRPDLHAVVHLHSTNATALACLRRGLPAVHYMVAVAGGHDVPCTPYHLFGSEPLSLAVRQAFTNRNACLMANHGLVAGGTTLQHAVKVAVEIEALCELYLKALAVGEPALLSADEMAQAVERFRTYGRAHRSS